MSDELYGQPAVANRDLIDQRQMLCMSDLASESGEAPQVRHSRSRRSTAPRSDKQGGHCRVSLTTNQPAMVLAKRT
jgi:hypothetical protein